MHLDLVWLFIITFDRNFKPEAMQSFEEQQHLESLGSGNERWGPTFYYKTEKVEYTL